MSSVKTKSKPTTSSTSTSKTSKSSKESSTTMTTTSLPGEKPSKFYFACRNNEIDTVTAKLPMLTVAEINKIEPNGSAALHAAAYYGHKEIVQLLLSKGAQHMIKNCHDCTPLCEAKTDDIKKLFQRPHESKNQPGGRFIGEQGPSYEWIFLKGDPSSYASFNRHSLLKCETNEQFDRLCRGVRQYYISEDGPLANENKIEVIRDFFRRTNRKK